MWPCQHFQARDNRALFPCHRGKRINIPRVCFQAALWNKSQTVVVSPGSPVPRNCLFSSHESPAPGGISQIPCGARGLLRARCAMDTCSRAAPHPWGAQLGTGVCRDPRAPGHLGSLDSPGHLALESRVCLRGPESDSIFNGKGLSHGTRALREEISWSQWLFPSSLPREEGDPRDAMASVLPPVGTCVSNTHLG